MGCFMDISLPKQKNRMGGQKKKTTNQWESEQFPAGFPIEFPCKKLVGNIFLLLGWLKELITTLLGGEGTKRAMDHEENCIPTPHPSIFPRALSFQDGQKLIHQLLAPSSQTYHASRHLSRSFIFLSEPTVKLFEISALVPKQPIATYPSDLTTSHLGQQW